VPLGVPNLGFRDPSHGTEWGSGYTASLLDPFAELVPDRTDGSLNGGGGVEQFNPAPSCSIMDGFVL